MKKWYIVFGLLMVIFILLGAGCGAAATPVPTPTQDLSKAKSIVEGRCSTCHGLAQVQAAKYDQAGWEAVVKRMVGNGAQLSAEQQQLAVQYLAQAYPK
jgi:mono/diheme cytochrome c family protein